MHCVLNSPRPSSFSVHRIVSESCRCLGANASSSELRALDQIQRLDVGAPTNMTQRRSVSALQPPDPCQPMPASRAGTRIERSYYHRIAEACTASVTAVTLSKNPDGLTSPRRSPCYTSIHMSSGLPPCFHRGVRIFASYRGTGRGTYHRPTPHLYRCPLQLFSDLPQVVAPELLSPLRCPLYPDERGAPLSSLHKSLNSELRNYSASSPCAQSPSMSMTETRDTSPRSCPCGFQSCFGFPCGSTKSGKQRRLFEDSRAHATPLRIQLAIL